MKENEQKILVAGVDGSKGGWVCVSGNLNSNDNTKFDIFNHFEEIIEKKFSLILVDMPIGLDEELMKGGRVVDREARGMLLKNKSSIFNPPSRLALKAKDYQEANKINKEQGMGLSKQSWFLFKKIKEIDTILEIKNRPEIFESHPELVFQVMKGGAIETKKNTQEGLKERIDILKENGFDKEFIEKFINKKNSFYKNDDFIDSCSLFWSAKRVVKNNEIQIPNKIIKDKKGIIMQMKI